MGGGGLGGGGRMGGAEREGMGGGSGIDTESSDET